MLNYQFMTKSHSVVYDEWMVSHPQPIGDYEPYPDNLKTTVCPACLFSSNEYSIGVDDYKYFFRSTSKNDRMIEFLVSKTDERFKVFLNEFTRFEQDSAALDARNQRPANTRSSATLQKIWQNKDQYGVPFISNIILAPPRDQVTVLACFTLDRYCQMLRIAYNYDVEPSSWDYQSLQDAIVEQFTEKPLSMKQPEPRFYYLGSSYLQSAQYLNALIESVDGAKERHGDLIEEFWRNAHTCIRLCMNNDDISAIPLETKEGGVNLLMAMLDFRFDENEAGLKCLRYAKNYADNRIKRISSQNQQNFVNQTEELYRKHVSQEVEEQPETKE